MKVAYRGSKKNNNKSVLFLSNQKGQFLIEAILLTIVLLGFFLVFIKSAKEKKFISSLATKPMENVQAMAGYGTWNKDGCKGLGKSSKVSLGKCHPNSIHRSISSDPK